MLATIPRLMAVPKKKTSKSRRDKRRATHGSRRRASTSARSAAQPKRPHRVCPTCETYSGREVEPLRTPRSVAMADPGRRRRDGRGPGPRRDRRGGARGRERRRSSRSSSARRARHARPRARRGDRDDRQCTRSPPKRCARSRTARSSPRAVRSAEGEADAVVSAGNTGAMLAAGLLEIRRLPGVDPAGDRRRRSRRARRPDRPHRRGRERRRAARSTSSSSATWARSSPRRSSRSASPGVRLLSIGEEAEKGNQLTLEAHALLAESGLNFRGNTEGRELLAAPPTSSSPTASPATSRSRPSRGRSGRSSTRSARRSPRRRRGKLGGLLIRPAARAAARRLDPDTYGGAYLLGLRGLVGDRARQLVAGRRSRTRSASPPAASSTTSSAARWIVCRADGGRFRAPRGSRPSEVRWQRRARKSSSGSRKS